MGTAVVTAVSTTTASTAVVHTVTLAGSDARTAGHEGTISLISGFRVRTVLFGTVPGFATQTLHFAAAVPEPGGLALLAAAGLGAGALVRRGRRLRPRPGPRR